MATPMIFRPTDEERAWLGEASTKAGVSINVLLRQLIRTAAGGEAIVLRSGIPPGQPAKEAAGNGRRRMGT